MHSRLHGQLSSSEGARARLYVCVCVYVCLSVLAGSLSVQRACVPLRVDARSRGMGNEREKQGVQDSV